MSNIPNDSTSVHCALSERSTVLTLIPERGPTRRVRRSQLHQGDLFQRLSAFCDSKSAVGVIVRNLFRLPEADLWRCLELAVSLPNCIQYQIAGSRTCNTLLDAVLETARGELNAEEAIRLRRVAVYIALAQHPDEFEVRCRQIQAALRQAGHRGVRIDQLRSEWRSLAEIRARNVDRESLVRVTTILPTAPVGPDVVIPAGWEMSAHGVTWTAGGAEIISTPTVIVERLRDVADGTISLRIAWQMDGRWHSHVVDREEIAASRTVTALAAYGYPTTSNNAPTVVQYLADFESANLHHLPTSRVTHQLGWHLVDGQPYFLWGHNLISAGGIVDTRETSGMATGYPAVLFRGADAGDEQVARAYHARGTMEGWLAAIAMIAEYPFVRFALYASFAAPLLELLGVSGFTVDFCGETSGGKTSTLRIGGSPWGNPDDADPSVIATWHGTAVCLERLPTLMNNLPVHVDDTKHVQNDRLVTSIVYAVSQGKGKGRGSKDGLAAQLTSRTIMISTGEEPITSSGQHGGTWPRVISLWGLPFGEKTPEHAEFVQTVVRSLKANYGHAGPEFIRRLIEDYDSVEEWRRLYHERVAHYTTMAGDDPLGGRRAEMLGVIYVAAVLAHEHLELPFEFEDPVLAVWDQIRAHAADADRAVAALKLIYEWAASHATLFYGRADDREPYHGWAGVWREDSRTRLWEFIADPDRRETRGSSRTQCFCRSGMAQVPRGGRRPTAIKGENKG